MRRGSWAAPRTRRRIFGLAVLAALAAIVAFCPAARAEITEQAVKATYLYKLVPFVTWPPSAFPAENSPITLCVVGEDPFGEILDRAVEGVTVAGRPLAVRRMRVVGPRPDCQIMYVAGSDAQPVSAALQEVHGRPVLTVTDSEQTPKQKGIINFVIEGRHVRFEIDDAAAAENGLTISSKLLSLALNVKPRK